MENNTHSEKEILIFNAVNELLNEGVKLHTVKVADIAKKAGIGKELFTITLNLKKKF
ncbi:hypothetical protein H477_1823 [[Clostridium] sordellii ATCC 9714]|nr:hypothetical protein H477_1823 [[Clostridium] sordellii ATCC 9714] [Paeniclostridium sordellii ATCC 9714]